MVEDPQRKDRRLRCRIVTLILIFVMEPFFQDATDDSETSSNELALSNVGGVFLVLGVGTALAFVFAIAEFLWNVHSVSVEEHVINNFCSS